MLNTKLLKGFSGREVYVKRRSKLRGIKQDRFEKTKSGLSEYEQYK